VQERYSTEEIAEIAPDANAQLAVSATCNMLIENQNVEAELGDDNVELRSIDHESLVVAAANVILEFDGPVSIMLKGDENDPKRTPLGGEARRCWGNYRGRKVIVEFKDRVPNPSQTDTRIAKKLNSLVRQLRNASSTEGFLLLDCEGYCKHGQAYRILYKPPPSFDDRKGQCQSLANVLLKKQYSDILRQNLQHRLNLSKALATTLYHLHTVQWVHKCVNPDNILIFGSEAEDGIMAFDWENPYLVGFDSSRASLSETDGVPPDERWENRAYIAPEYQSTSHKTHQHFQKIFDLYSLGVILLEIGLGHCFKASKFRSNKEWSGLTSGALKQKFIRLAKELKGDLGPLYSEVVVTCLSGRFDIKEEEEDQHETLLLAAFRSEVCEKLDEIRI
jgi:hypothetical protein